MSAATKSAVKVLVRVRPANCANPWVGWGAADGKVTITPPGSKPEIKAAHGPTGSVYTFKFDAVLPDATQEEVYEAAAASVLQAALDGCNGTILCYGQTGAGKTYTMSGGRQAFAQRGLVPRVLSALFKDLGQRMDLQAKVVISYIEIYNDQIYDLLDITTQPHEISIQDCGPAGGTAKGVRLQGVRATPVACEADAIRLLFEGEANRVIGEHQLNRESSRSHAIFQVHLEISTGGEGGTRTTMASKLSLVDLAGSERVSKTRSEGSVLREAGHINRSLSILEQVVAALGERGRDHVPYRSCKLTHALRDALGGNCATVLVANVWGDPEQLDETLSTLRFAQRMLRVTCEVAPNVVEDTSAKARQLQRQVLQLQQELAMHDAMAGRAGVVYDPYTPQQRAALAAQLDEFLANPEPDSIAPLELNSLRHMREVLCALRGRVRAAEAAAAETSASHAASIQGSGAAAPTASGERPLSPTSALVARLGVGEGPPPPPPPLPPDDVSQSSEPKEEAAAAVLRPAASPHPPAAPRPAQPVSPPRDRSAALQLYREGPGASKAALLEENRSRLRAVKKRAKELGLAINALVAQLDALKREAEAHRQQRAAGPPDTAQVLGPDELRVLEAMQGAKTAYRDQYAELQMVRSEVAFTQQLCTACGQEMLSDAQTWHMQAFGVPLPLAPPADAGGDRGGDALSPDGAGAASEASGTAAPTSSSGGGAPAAAPSSATSSAGGAPAQGAKGRMSQAAGAKHGRGVKPSPSKPAAPPHPEQGELADPGAAAFYSAQHAMLARTTGGAARPGSAKKKTGPNTTFSLTQRADITARTSSDVFAQPGPASRSPAKH